MSRPPAEPSWMEREIRAQPELLRTMAGPGSRKAAEVVAAVAARAPRFAVIAARGTSDRAAIYAKYLLEIHAGLVASLAAPSVHSIYHASPNIAEALVVGISQSGQSPDVVAVVEDARSAGGLTLAITNNESSPMAEAAEHVFPLHAGEERSVAATKTFMAELLACWLLAAAIAGLNGPPVEQIAADVEQSLASAERSLAGYDLGASETPVVVIGRGFTYPIALEVALKLREAGLRPAEGFSAADLMHGPIAALTPGTRALLVGASGPTIPNLLASADALRARGATIITISDDPALNAAADLSVPVPAASEATAALPLTIAGQWLALQDGLSRGLDPDHPPSLHKVTRTL